MPDQPPQDSPNEGGENYHLTLPEFLTATDLLLTNAADPEIAPLLTGAGYPAATITALKAELADLRTLSEKQEDEYGDQYEATQNLDNAWAAVKKTHKLHIGLARLAFKDSPDGYTSLGLAGERKPSFSGYTTQALLFYDNALAHDSFKTALEDKGVGETALTSGRDAVKALLTKRAVLKKETGEAQEATHDRDMAYDTLFEKISDLRETAKLVLEDHPQLSEKLGIKDPSSSGGPAPAPTPDPGGGGAGD